MMTASIYESLSMGPSMWSEWQNMQDAALWADSLSGENLEQWDAYSQWCLPTIEQSFEPKEVPIVSSTKAPEPWRASPLRVPLPEPLFSGGSLSTDAPMPLTELPPGLESRWPQDGGAVARVELEMTGLEEVQEQLLWKPPGLVESASQMEQDLAAAAAALPQKPATPAQSAACLDVMPQGLSIRTLEAGTRVEWQIESFCPKFQSSPSRPIVSPPFAACGLPNLRLVVNPVVRDSQKVAAKKCAAKKTSKKAVVTGPAFGGLKLKADCLTGPTVMTFKLTVGDFVEGPYTFDFSEQAVQGPSDLACDWLEHVDQSSGSIRLGVEILEVQRKAR